MLVWVIFLTSLNFLHSFLAVLLLFDTSNQFEDLEGIYDRYVITSIDFLTFETIMFLFYSQGIKQKRGGLKLGDIMIT